MTEVTTIEEFSALDEEGVALFIGKRLFNLCSETVGANGKVYKGYTFSVPEEEERWELPSNYTDWFYDSEGLRAIKQAMAVRGYNWRTYFDQRENRKGQYHHLFQKYGITYQAIEDTEEKAVINAAAKSLLSEGE